MVADVQIGELSRFMKDVTIYAKALKEVTGCVKINYEIHGNTLPHLHMHLYPRYTDDPFSGTPIDHNDKRVDIYREGEYDSFVERIYIQQIHPLSVTLESKHRPSFPEMIRAPFLFAIIVPLISGTLVSVIVSGSFSAIGFFLILIIGLSLHITTNVYNDIYDTKQGADDHSSMKSEFSGGSGILVDDLELLPKMYLIARSGIIVGISGALFLMLFIDRTLWISLWMVIGTAVFLSKYYTADPFKFAYRGMGELVVFIGFGPLAVMLAGIGQNTGLHPALLSISPITGFGTLFIVWMGEMVDLPTDLKGGKIGAVARIGIHNAAYGLMAIHLSALLCVLFVVLFILDPGWPLLIVLIPYSIILPNVWKELKDVREHDKLVNISKLNFILYVSFSLFLMLGYTLNLMLNFW